MCVSDLTEWQLNAFCLVSDSDRLNRQEGNSIIKTMSKCVGMSHRDIGLGQLYR